MTNDRKVRMTMPIDEPMVVIDNPIINDEVNVLCIFSLENFEYKDGNIKWIMTTPEGRIVTGGLGETEIDNIAGKGKVRVVLSIPVTLHKQSPSLAPEFIILIPEDLRVYTLKTLKNKYGTPKALFR